MLVFRQSETIINHRIGCNLHVLDRWRDSDNQKQTLQCAAELFRTPYTHIQRSRSFMVCEREHLKGLIAHIHDWHTKKNDQSVL